jgi:hypothetical protein
LVQPDRPFSNLRALRRLIREAQGCLRWYERDMPSKVLELVGDEIAETQASEIRLLSGDLSRSASRLREGVRQDLRRFRAEYAELGVRIEWRELVEGDVPHDRVLIDDRRSLNVPPLNTLLKGDVCEITPSLLGAAWFDDLWERAALVD